MPNSFNKNALITIIAIYGKAGKINIKIQPKNAIPPASMAALISSLENTIAAIKPTTIKTDIQKHNPIIHPFSFTTKLKFE